MRPMVCDKDTQFNTKKGILGKEAKVHSLYSYNEQQFDFAK